MPIAAGGCRVMNYLHKQWDFYIGLALCQEFIPGYLCSLLLLGSKQLQYIHCLHIKLSVTKGKWEKYRRLERANFFVDKST